MYTETTGTAIRAQNENITSTFIKGNNMLDFNSISPYIRFASHSWLSAFNVRKRIIYDYELILIEKGVWEFIYEDNSYKVGENDIIFICPGKIHEMRKVGELPVKQPHIHFDIFYEDSSKDIGISYKLHDNMTKAEKAMLRQNIFEDADSFKPVFRISDIGYFKHLFFEIVDCYIDKPPMHELTCKTKMIELLMYIIEDRNLWNLNDNDGKRESVMLTNVYQYISKNFHKRITLGNLANICNYNISYLDRKYKSKYGVSPMVYYKSLRINEIKKLLQSGNSISEIINIMSFSSIYSFSRYFKNAVGMSPTEYIKNNG